jgi:hypothetical protein
MCVCCAWQERTIQHLAATLLRTQIDARQTQQNLTDANERLTAELEALRKQLSALNPASNV